MSCCRGRNWPASSTRPMRRFGNGSTTTTSTSTVAPSAAGTTSDHGSPAESKMPEMVAGDLEGGTDEWALSGPGALGPHAHKAIAKRPTHEGRLARLAF